jgi:hypothetical protein
MSRHVLIKWIDITGNARPLRYQQVAEVVNSPATNQGHAYIGHAGRHIPCVPQPSAYIGVARLGVYLLPLVHAIANHDRAEASKSLSGTSQRHQQGTVVNGRI